MLVGISQLASTTSQAGTGTTMYFLFSEGGEVEWPTNVDYAGVNQPITSGSPVCSDSKGALQLRLIDSTAQPMTSMVYRLKKLSAPIISYLWTGPVHILTFFNFDMASQCF